MAVRKDGGVPDDRRKAAASGAAPRTHNGGEARGRDKGKGARLRTVEGIGGRKREAGAGEKDRKARRGEKVRRVVVVWVQLLARAYI